MVSGAVTSTILVVRRQRVKRADYKRRHCKSFCLKVFVRLRACVCVCLWLCVRCLGVAVRRQARGCGSLYRKVRCLTLIKFLWTVRLGQLC